MTDMQALPYLVVGILNVLLLVHAHASLLHIESLFQKEGNGPLC